MLHKKYLCNNEDLKENRLGETGDNRALIDQGKLDLPISNEPAEVSPRGSGDGIGSSFYADEGIVEG